MKFPYKVKIGDEIIPAWTEIPEIKESGAVEETAPVLPEAETEMVVREGTVPVAEAKKRGRHKK